ncbi:MAG TPA: uroporphyrinogen-III C-methyltransferase [Amaricoccus sp.]|uniref:uroporphyrinogen-III C-methyltransferase n=1 Tax=Amaricoccus sp. TaxID=1872485 RepID=UPI002C72B3DC|nr:uroporphyrinogen-III C-methyltransferase [Amaricoccus sp.]HMQ92520.1 uroporphyrinogen-III C-methyltransferase [Amaricoccus sp.]HMR54012.1 uroporphyrinogen-III C-methyltransferase [Amaricoccus sp.]HMR60097.1 uroporphyrinogen-III C-methyltransferase [Amaricoccus sp.]HMU00987.1 uroporphyrinogen-III C-methyltransferase [Amaricoccus sp.]
MAKLEPVLLVGAGPGDPDLLTVRAMKAIGRAGAIVHDRLVSPEILALARDDALLVPVGKTPRHHPVPQERINAILIDLALRGLAVVRLKGGDPFVFGRGGEEALALRAAGIPVEVVPGITAAQGAAAAVGAPLTQRGLATGLRYVTGHCHGDGPLDLDWAGLADPGTTLVVYMGVATMAEIAARLMAHGMPGDLPVLAVAEATTPRERRLVSRLDAIARDAREAGLAAPVLFVVGRVAALAAPPPLAAQLRAMAANA